MRDDTDFIALYDELGLDSECSLACFRQAYRRRVAMLHPDHPGDSSDISRLQRLNRMYAAAMEFHRLHGRLPGATRRTKAGGIAGARPPNAEIGAPVGAGSVAGPRPDRRYLLVALPALAALYWLGAQSETVARLDPEGSADAAASGATSAPKVARIGVGTERALVLQIQGTPLRQDGHRWHYGSSWIDFACGQVVDWYSSPLAPLKVGDRNPEARRHLAVPPPYRC
jgi:hypothetical protein